MIPTSSDAIAPETGGEGSSSATPRQRFEPSVWDSVHGNSAPTPSQLLFRRVNEEVFRAAEPLIRRGRLWLDLGCGTGDLTRRLAATGARAWGVDHDPAMSNWASRRMEDPSPAAFLTSDALRIPVADGSVDGVIAASLTGCLEKPEPFMRELARILTPGSPAVISFTNGDSLLLGLADRWLREKVATDVNHARHGCFRRYQVEKVVQLASRTGLHTNSIRHFNCFADLARWSLPPRPVARVLEHIHTEWVHRRLCRNFVVVFRSAQPGFSRAS